MHTGFEGSRIEAILIGSSRSKLFEGILFSLFF